MASPAPATDTESASPAVSFVTILRTTFLVLVIGGLVGLGHERAARSRHTRIPTHLPLVMNLGLPPLDTPIKPEPSKKPALTPVTEAVTTRPETSETETKPEKPTLVGETLQASRATSEPEAPGTQTTEPMSTQPNPDGGTRKATPETAAQPDTTPEPAPKPLDWSKHEITGPIPRPNIVIYLRHRVLMLRSHADIVRTYRNISVPAALTDTDKPSATQRYQITARDMRDQGPALGIKLKDRTLWITARPADATALTDDLGLHPGEVDELYRAVTRGAYVLFVP